MISARNAYILNGGTITTNRSESIRPSDVNTYSYNIGYYDDTKIKERLSLLESEVESLESVDANYGYRLSLLESHESGWASKSEVESVERRVTKLETIPVGLTNSQMNEILND